MGSVPPQPKTVPIRAAGRLQRLEALGDQRVHRLGDVLIESGDFAPIRDPAAHGRSRVMMVVAWRASCSASAILRAKRMQGVTASRVAGSRIAAPTSVIAGAVPPIHVLFVGAKQRAGCTAHARP